MGQNDIDDVLDHLRRIKGGGDLNSVKIDQIETLEVDLRLLRTFMKCWFEHSLTNEQTLEINRFIKKLKVVQKKMRFFRYLYVTEINGYVDHEKMEGLETRIQFMADNVGQFCLALSSYEDENEVDIWK
ncbi:hypothetical protein T459_32359 [Capsicum annuum]|uniref:Uncharacterized protein n=1 Tax=Capsicum annuum TaxID=4072 RepID=A0A2G2Y288_CAPAN|nr:hypothetical protein T459_32359 [Capsicum annuum]